MDLEWTYNYAAYVKLQTICKILIIFYAIQSSWARFSNMKLIDKYGSPTEALLRAVFLHSSQKFPRLLESNNGLKQHHTWYLSHHSMNFAGSTFPSLNCLTSETASLRRQASVTRISRSTIDSHELIFGFSTVDTGVMKYTCGTIAV